MIRSVTAGVVQTGTGCWRHIVKGCVVMNKKIRDKVLYILAWLVMVCAGILIQTEDTDRLWQIIYRGIYDSTNTDVGASGRTGRNSTPADVEDYVNYWESQVREVCDDGIRDAGKNINKNTGGSDGKAAGKNAEKNSDDNENNENNNDKDSPEIYSGKSTDESGQKNTEKGGGTEEKQADGTADIQAENVLPVMADISSSYIGMDSDTLLSYCYNATYPKCVKSDELDAENLLSKDVSLDMSTGGYKVLIYHTHSSEGYADSRPGETDDTVVGLGQKLADILTDTYGIPVYHDTTEYDMMTGTLDRNASYDYSREGVSQILAENPEIEVMIDLHRDGVPDDTHLVTEVNGRDTAQIMLINGMCRDEEGNDVDYWSNDNKVDNMALALQTYLAGRGNYGDIMRKIYISTCRYNMDLMPHAMLAEIGAQTNTVEEAENAMEPFAAMLAKVLLN